MADLSGGQAVKQLRELTGLGIVECKKILDEHGGDFEKAKRACMEKGIDKGKIGAREATEGVIEFYRHHDQKTGVMIELRCNTDFVARGDDFRALARDLALHIAAVDPLVIRREELDQSLVTSVRENFVAETGSNKPPEILNRIVDGKMTTWFKERVLLDQPFVKNESQTVQELIDEVIKKTRENIIVARFARFKVGDPLPGLNAAAEVKTEAPAANSDDGDNNARGSEIPTFTEGD